MSVVKSTYKFVFYPLAALLSIITLLIIIQPSGGYYRVFTNSAVEVMLGIIGFGLLCLLLQWHRLMFVAFTCTGILCLFLKSSSNPAPVYATPNTNKDIEVIHLNLSNLNEGYEELADLLLVSGADLISVQELDPFCDEILRGKILDSFPHYKSMPNVSFNGMAVFSKHPLSNLDTFNYKDIPNLTGLIKPKDGAKPIRFISTYTNPTFGEDKYYQELKGHFETIVEEIKGNSETLLAFGTYNTVAWSSEMKFFTGALGLQNSRRSTSPFSQNTYKHIFHSMDMECVSFDGLYDAAGEEIGLKVKLHTKNLPISNYDQGPTE